MRPLDLGTYIKHIYQSTQTIHLTEHGRAAKKFMLDKVFSSLAVRSATEVERAIILKLQDLIGAAEGLDMHAVQLATSVAVGKVSQNKVAMGILEGAMMKLEDPRKGNSLQGRLRGTSEFIKERLQCTALTVASKHCSNKLKDMLGIMKSPGVLQDRMVRVPSCFAALEDEERMRECALAIRSLSPEGSSFVLTSDATCLAAGVLPCSAKWSPIEGPVMLGGVWHWSGDCTPIIKSRMADTGQWSPEVPVTEIVPATYIWVITVRRSDHSMNHIPILELPLLRESMPQEEYATVIARAIIVSTTSGMLVPWGCL